MGRRKIEIKPIKDNRNRSVTFFKRKNGLFKKAHELSVLCSVNIAVIILGNTKELYEYSSSNIAEILQQHNSYRGAKEHKGPLDFSGSGHWDEKGGSEKHTVETNFTEESPTMPPQFPNQAATPQMRQSLCLSPPLQYCAHNQHQHTSKPHLKSHPEFSTTQNTSSDLAQNIQATYPSSVVNSYDCISSSRHSALTSQPQQHSSFQSHWSPVPPLKPQPMHMNEQQRASMSTDFQKPVPQNRETLQPPQLEQHPEQLFCQAQQARTEQMPEQQLMFIEPRINLIDQSRSHNSAVILPQLSPSSSARLDFAQNQDTVKKRLVHVGTILGRRSALCQDDL
ncbi:Transcription factor rlm1 [Pseudogymnoascus australis]